MVDAADSKSAGSDIVRVRVSPWAPSKMTSFWFVCILCEQLIRVDKMVDKNGASFLYRKRGVYYFSKQVPCDIKAHYSRQRVVICLKTKSKGTPERLTKSLLQRLKYYWLYLRLLSMTLPAEHIILKKIDAGSIFLECAV